MLPPRTHSGVAEMCGLHSLPIRVTCRLAIAVLLAVGARSHGNCAEAPAAKHAQLASVPASQGSARQDTRPAPPAGPGSWPPTVQRPVDVPASAIAPSTKASAVLVPGRASAPDANATKASEAGPSQQTAFVWSWGQFKWDLRSEDRGLLWTVLALGALPIVAVVGLLVYGTLRRKAQTDGAKTAGWSPHRVALLVLVCAAPGVTALLLTLSRTDHEPGQTAVEAKGARNAVPPIGSTPPPQANGVTPSAANAAPNLDLNTLKSDVAELRVRLASLSGAPADARGRGENGAVSLLPALLVAQLPIYAVLAVLIYVLSHRSDIGWPRRAVSNTTQSKPSTLSLSQPYEGETNPLRDTQFHLDETYAFLERAPIAAASDSVLNLSGLAMSLSALLTRLPPQNGEFEWRLRSSRFNRSTLLAEEFEFRKVLRQIEVVLNDLDWEEPDSSGRRLESEMRALRRVLLSMDPDVPKLGPGIRVGPVRAPTAFVAKSREKSSGEPPGPNDDVLKT